MTSRILLVDDHRLVAMAVSIALDAHGYETIVADSPRAERVFELVDHHRPACVLLDLHLGGGQRGLDLIPTLRRSGAEVVMLTSERDQLVLAACLEAGSAGWVAKDADLDEVVHGVALALRGESVVGRTKADEVLALLREHRRRMADAHSPFQRLSVREQVVLDGLMEGRSAEEIAEAECVTLATVRSQIRTMLQKLGVHSQLAAVAQARKAGWQLRNETETAVHQ